MTAFHELDSTLVISGDDCFLTLFKTFYKVIEKGDYFDIWIINDAGMSEENIKGIIHFMPEPMVEALSSRGILEKMKEHESYKADEIVIRTSDIPDNWL